MTTTKTIEKPTASKAEIVSEIYKDGNSYAIRIKKALVDAKVFEIGKKYKFVCESEISGAGKAYDAADNHNSVYGIESIKLPYRRNPVPT